MAAFMISTAEVKDSAKLEEYGAMALPTIAAFGGEPLARGPVKEVLSGETSAQIAIVVKFPSAEKAHAWYNSDLYQKCIPTRLQAIDPTIVVIEE